MNRLRLKAAERGDRFFESKPCRGCGEMPRYVSTGKCVACVKRRTREYQDEVAGMLAKARAHGTEVSP